jgi:hypothetical protein
LTPPKERAVRQIRISEAIYRATLSFLTSGGHGSISTTLHIYAHVFPEHMEQFERQRARILGTSRAPDVGAVAEEQQVA